MNAGSRKKKKIGGDGDPGGQVRDIRFLVDQAP